MELTCVEDIHAGEGVGIKTHGTISTGNLAYRWQGSNSKALGISLIGVARDNFVRGERISAVTNPHGGGLLITRIPLQAQFGRIIGENKEGLAKLLRFPSVDVESKPSKELLMSAESSVPIREIEYEMPSNSQENNSATTNLRAELEARLEKALARQKTHARKLEESNKEVLQLNAAIGGLSILD